MYARTHTHKHGFNHMRLQAHTYMDSPTCMHAHTHKHGFNHMRLQAHIYMDSPTCMHAHTHKHGFNHMRLQAHTYMDSSTCACMHAHTDTHPQKEFLLIAYHKVHRLWWLSLSPRDWLRRDHNVGAHRRG